MKRDIQGIDSIFGCMVFIMLCTIVALWLSVVAQNAVRYVPNADIQSEELLDYALSATIELHQDVEGDAMIIETSVHMAIVDLVSRAMKGVNDSDFALELDQRIKDVVSFLLGSNAPWKIDVECGLNTSIVIASSEDGLSSAGDFVIVERRMTLPDGGTVRLRLTLSIQ